ncbi:MAG: prenyltransferase/squalene oxidase repeat-containing protein, partial [Planctomycetota bacterium]
MTQPSTTRWRAKRFASSLACAVLLTLSAAARADLPHQVDAAIARGVRFLLRYQDDDTGAWREFNPEQRFRGGLTALVTYALLESGVAPDDEAMTKALEHLADTWITGTYGLALRANVWNAVPGGEHRARLANDVSELMGMARNGAYGYEAGGSDWRWDNSNSEYGAFGVWAGARADVPVSESYWRDVLRHWAGDQNPDGGWGYFHGRSFPYPDGTDYYGPATEPAMTAAGIATLFICVDNLPEYGPDGDADDLPPSLQRG